MRPEDMGFSQGVKMLTLSYKDIITVASVLAAIFAIVGYLIKVYRWYEKQEAQDKAIAAMKEELSLLTYGVLACLKGLKEQGCNGPVTKAIDDIEKYINKKAHDQTKEV